VIDPEAPSRLALGEVEAPRPQRSEALVRVKAISLNRGEVRRAGSAEAGATIGWDIAGVVEAPAEDGSGPALGTRVVGMLASGAWAERIALPTNALAPLPDAVTDAQAACLPVAGVTALRALEHGGLLSGKRVLITGASGGVGQFALQIANAAGALTVGSVRQQRSEACAREMGAHEVVVGDDLEAARQHGPFDLVVESVGGDSLAQALTMLAPAATCVALGASASGQSTINVSAFYLTGGATLYGFILFYEHARNPIGRDLGRLVALVAAGTLRVPVALEASWERVGQVAQQLTDRAFTGKAVLYVD
jgi:NADPH:quinone reductase-like Zn-dependent oxidoreductase